MNNASFTVQPDETRTISFVIPAGTRPWTVHWTCDRYGYRSGARRQLLLGPAAHHGGRRTVGLGTEPVEQPKRQPGEPALLTG